MVCCPIVELACLSLRRAYHTISVYLEYTSNNKKGAVRLDHPSRMPGLGLPVLVMSENSNQGIDRRSI